MTQEMTSPDTEDIALLRAAAQEIRDNRIPHIISEDDWVARDADIATRGVLYSQDRFIDIVDNIRSAKSVLFPSASMRDIEKNLFGEDGVSRIRYKLVDLRVAWKFLKANKLSMPDAEVNGNLVHWGEHAAHIALWSPEVTDTIAVFLDAEADAREAGFSTSASPEAVAMAKEIVEKQIYDDTPQVAIPIRPYWVSALDLVPARKNEYRRRIFYMRELNANYSTSRYITHRFGLLPTGRAMREASKLRVRVARSVLNSAKGSSARAYHETMVLSIDCFTAAVLSDPEEFPGRKRRKR